MDGWQFILAAIVYWHCSKMVASYQLPLDHLLAVVGDDIEFMSLWNEIFLVVLVNQSSDKILPLLFYGKEPGATIQTGRSAL